MGDSRSVHPMGLYWGFSLGMPWNSSMPSSLPWVMLEVGIPWDCIGASHWGFHGILQCLAHCHGTLCIPWHCIMGLHTGDSMGLLQCLAQGDSRSGHPMGLQWGFSLGIPWNSSMLSSLPWVMLEVCIPWDCIGASHWGVHGMLQCLAHCHG